MSAKKASPVDLRDAAWIRDAVSFNAMLFLGAGRYDRADGLPSLDAANAAAAELEARNPGPRRAMVFAVTATGHSCMVTPTLRALAETLA